jgi:type I restriction enzyme S subunit
VGKTAFFNLEGNYAFSNHMTRIRLPESVSGRFLAHQLHFLWMNGYFKSICRNHVNQASVASSVLAANVTVLIPPLAEQVRIVDAIDDQFSRIDAGIRSLDRAKRQLGQLQASTIDALIDRSHQRVPMSLLAEMSLGKMLDRKRLTGSHKHPYLRNVNVRWFGFELSDLATMDVAPHEFERVSVRQGDLVVCEGGEPGRSAVWNGEPIAIQKALHRVRPGSDVLAEYLAIVLRWWVDQPDFTRFITGTTIKHVPKEKLQQLPVPLPSLEEQSRIVAQIQRQLSISDEISRGIHMGLHRAAALRRSFLSAAFRGRRIY